MRIDASLPPTNPYHLARAYNLSSAKAPAQVSQAQPSGAPADVRAPARVQDVPGVSLSSQSPASASINRLVAAVVPGRVDFSGDIPRPGASELAFYRHPADKNAAATGVQVGRSLDVSG